MILCRSPCIQLFKTTVSQNHMVELVLVPFLHNIFALVGIEIVNEVVTMVCWTRQRINLVLVWFIGIVPLYWIVP
jgi:hypothetical protein